MSERIGSVNYKYHDEGGKHEYIIEYGLSPATYDIYFDGFWCGIVHDTGQSVSELITEAIDLVETQKQEV